MSTFSCVRATSSTGTYGTSASVLIGVEEFAVIRWWKESVARRGWGGIYVLLIGIFDDIMFPFFWGFTLIH